VPNVLIRDVPADDLELIRSAARERGISLQAYLRETVHRQAAYLRRREALAAMSNRLRHQPDVPEEERAAVLEAIAAEHARRADRIIDASKR
jgi:hypothetical protein